MLPYFCSSFLHMRDFRLIGIVVLTLCLPLLLCSQNSKSTALESSFTLNTQTIDKESVSYEVLALLASNNGHNIHKISIPLQYKFEYSIQRISSSQYSLQMQLKKSQLASAVMFRDFNVSQWMLGGDITATVNLQTHTGSIRTIQIILNTANNHSASVLFEHESLSGSDMEPIIRIDAVNMNAATFKDFQEHCALINSYNAYAHVLGGFIMGWEQASFAQHDRDTELLVIHQEILRIDNQIRKHKILETLHLEKNDPLHFRKDYKRFQRIVRRVETLSKQSLENIKGSKHEASIFAIKVAELSARYIRMAKNQQPYIASAYNEMVRMSTSSGELEFIRQVSHVYATGFSGKPSCALLLYDELNTLADSLSSVAKFAEAMDILKNAELIQHAFNEIEQSDYHASVYIRTMDGMMSSYLKVARMAYESGNATMALTYQEKAQSAYDQNVSFFKNTKLSDAGLHTLFEAHMDLAMQRASQKAYEEAITYLNTLKNICDQRHAQTYYKTLDSAFQQVYVAYVKQMESEAEHALIAGKLDVSQVKLEQAQNLLVKQKHYLISKATTDGIQSLAYALYLEWLQDGEIYLDQKKPEKALYYFSKARKLEQLDLVVPVARLQSLISQAVLPQLFQLIEEASLDTWANRISEAEKKYQEIKSKQTTYGFENHQELNSKIKTLEDKMFSRLCVDIKYRYDAHIQQLQNSVNRGLLEEAMQHMDSAAVLASQDASCQVDKDKLRHFEQLYKYLFEFKNRYENLKQVLYTQSYWDLIPLYQDLMHFYQQHHIRRFGHQLPSFYDFVEAQNLTSLTKTTIEYYLAHEQIHLAFEYLQLIRKQNAEPKPLKGIQMQLGASLQNRDQMNKTERAAYVSEYTDNDPWYRYFKQAYIN